MMRYRKLRIAWSVVWGLVAVLLCVLWVRSFNWFDDLAFLFNNSQSMMALQTEPGSLVWTKQEAGGDTFSKEYYSRFFNTNRRQDPPDLTLASIAGKFLVLSFAVSVPFWFLVIVSATLAAIPWFRWSKRFSLRTLLIATTLVAVVLGLVIYAARN